MQLLPTTQNTKTVTDMREDASGLLEDNQKHDLFYLFYKSKPKSVMISIRRFQQILDLLEDYLDSLEAQSFEEELKNADPNDFISFEDILKEYNVG